MTGKKVHLELALTRAKNAIKKLRGGGIKTQSINDQMDRQMDKRQVEIAI